MSTGATGQGETWDGQVERRRSARDRRHRLWYSLAYGGLKPRRRGGRRAGDHYRPIIDWHGPGIFASSLLVLVLCVVDAFLTLALLSSGLVEANPVMARVVGGTAEHFAAWKLLLTGSGVLVLVALSRFRVFRVLRVATILHSVVIGYLVLIGYELLLLRDSS